MNNLYSFRLDFNILHACLVIYSDFRTNGLEIGGSDIKNFHILYIINAYQNLLTFRFSLVPTGLRFRGHQLNGCWFSGCLIRRLIERWRSAFTNSCQ